MRANWLKKYLKAAFLVAAVAVAGCAAKPLPTDGPGWNTHLGDYGRTNISSGKVALPMVVGWNRDVSKFTFMSPFPDEQLSSPAIHKGRLYAGSVNGYFYASDLASGKVYWKFNANSPIEAAPTVSDDKTCFGASDGKMRCLDLEGKLLWQFQARSEILSSPVIKDGKVLFASSDDRIHALDEKTGERLWTYSRGVFKTVTPRVYASPALTGNGNLMYLFSDGAAVCVSAVTGKEVWSKKVVKEFEGPLPPRRTLVADSGSIYMIDGNMAVVALEEATGEIKGIYNIIKATDFVVPDARTIVIAGEGQAMALDRTTGALLWKTPLEHGPVSSVFSAGGYLFVLSNYKKAPLGIDYFARDTGYIEALRLSDGVHEWGRRLGSSINADASSAFERVALITNDGKLTVLEPKD